MTESRQPTGRSPEEERRTLRAARRGEPEALRTLLSALERTARVHLERRMGSRLARYTDVDDLLQETFSRALRGLDALGDDATFEDFRGILLQNANWVLRDRGSRAQTFLSESIAYVGETPPPEPPARREPESRGPVTRMDDGAWLRQQVEGLDPKYRDVVRLLLEGKSYGTIGDALGIGEETARKRAQRALEQLRTRAASERDQRT